MSCTVLQLSEKWWLPKACFIAQLVSSALATPTPTQVPFIRSPAFLQGWLCRQRACVSYVELWA